VAGDGRAAPGAGGAAMGPTFLKRWFGRPRTERYRSGRPSLSKSPPATPFTNSFTATPASAAHSVKVPSPLLRNSSQGFGDPSVVSLPTKRSSQPSPSKSRQTAVCDGW